MITMFWGSNLDKNIYLTILTLLVELDTFIFFSSIRG